MAQDTQYFRIKIGDAIFLLHGTASLAVEKRDNMQANTGSGNAVAWHADQSGNWPAYALDADLRLSQRDSWSHAVFITSVPHPVGLAADEIQLMADEEIVPEPFTPLGTWVPGVGRLFSNAWVYERRVYLVIDPGKFALYLQTLG